MKFMAIVICFGLGTHVWAADLTSTPAGYRQKGLVRQVEAGQTIRKTGGSYQIIAADGTVVGKIKRTPKVSMPLDANGWITYTKWSLISGESVLSFATSWAVPPVPSSRDNQLVYLFNGMTTASDTVIIQPVLQFGVSGAGGGDYWSVASWYVTSDGQAFHTQAVKVNPGDVLTGVMTEKGNSGQKYSYSSEFKGIANTYLGVEGVEQMQNIYETLEAYNVTGCGDYPTGMTAFREINIELWGNISVPNWTPVNRVTDCGQHASVISNSQTDGEVDLAYGQ